MVLGVLNSITGYLTEPRMKEDEYLSLAKTLKGYNLEVLLFNRGKRGDDEIGPNGILFTGKAALNDKSAIKITYGSVTPQVVDGMTYDVSSLSLSLKNYFFAGVHRRPKPNSNNSYFGLRVDAKHSPDIDEFNKYYLNQFPLVGIREGEPGVVVYDHFTMSDMLYQQLELAMKELEDGKVKLLEKETTILPQLFPYNSK